MGLIFDKLYNTDVTLMAELYLIELYFSLLRQNLYFCPKKCYLNIRDRAGSGSRPRFSRTQSLGTGPGFSKFSISTTYTTNK